MADRENRLTIGDGFRFGLGFVLAGALLSALAWLAAVALLARGISLADRWNAENGAPPGYRSGR